MTDLINHPPHYSDHNGSGIECIDITEHLGFNLGNAVKYLWRFEDKDDPAADLRKAQWYVRREIGRIGAGDVGRGVSLAARQLHGAWYYHEPDSPRRQAITELFIAASTQALDRGWVLSEASRTIDAMIEAQA